MKLFVRFTKKKARQPALMPGQDGYAFRRSRTLTGTTSHKVTPTAEQRSQLKTKRLQAHELHQQRNRILRLLGIIGLFIALLSFLLSNYIGNLSLHYPQTGANQPTTTAYQHSLNSYFAIHPFERFGFSLQRGRLQDFMRTKHSEISGLDIDKAWYGGDAKFIIYFRTPLLVWQTSGQQFFVDDRGVAFGYNHFGGTLVPVTDQSGIASDVGTTVASSRFIRFLGKMVGAVNAGGMGRVNTVIIPPSTREIDLKLDGREYLIKTHIDRDPLQQAEDIVNALKHFDSKRIVPQYVDVRVANKAYYK